jgi:LuxR family quorum sensing-dependent transcriptional regulator
VRQGLATSAWADRAFQFIDALGGCKTPQKILTEFQTVVRDAGFHALLITGLPNPGNRIEPLVLANGWPSGWYELYTERNFVTVDPIVAHCFRSLDPFEWKDVRYDPAQAPRADEVMMRARDFGMDEGYCIPIHGGDGFESVVTMAGHKVDLGGHAKEALHLMGMYAHARCRTMLSHASGKRQKPLTPSEKEVMRWTALGKSSRQIAVTLKITERTVNAHVANAMRKLDARNRVAAAVTAVVRGHIQL